MIRQYLPREETKIRWTLGCMHAVCILCSMLQILKVALQMSLSYLSNKALVSLIKFFVILFKE